MALPQTDAFTRANSNTVGGAWTEVEYDAASAGINSNRLFLGDAGLPNWAVVYQTDGTSSMYAQAAYQGRAAAVAFDAGLIILGAQGSSGSGYIDGYGLVIVRNSDWGGSNDLVLVKFTNVDLNDNANPPTGVTVLGGYTVPTWNLGDTIKIAYSGGTLDGYYNGTKQITVGSQTSYTSNTWHGFVNFNSATAKYFDDYSADIVAVAPTLSLPTSASITKTTATLGATVDSDGNDTITERGVVWALTANPTTSDTKVTTTGTTGLFTVAVTALPRNKTIHYRGFATNSIGTSYTSDDSFSTKKGGGSVIVIGGGGGKSPSWSPGGIRPNMYGT